MIESRRTRITFVIALGVHAGFVLAFGRSPPQVLHTSGQPPAEASIELDLSVPSATMEANASPMTSEHPVVAAVRTHARGIPTHDSTSTDDSSVTIPEAPRASTEPTPAPAPGPRLSLSQMGVGVTAPLVTTRPGEKRPDPVAQAARNVEKSINDELARRDRELGLGSDGPVVSALELATYGSALNGNGKATFVARIDSSGRVNLLSVVNVNGDHEGWRRVASHALRVLSRKKLRVPQGAKGIELRISVESRWAMPSGADPGLEVRMLGVPLKKGQGKRSARISILEPKAKVEMVEVPQPGGTTVPMPMPQIGIGVLGVAGDLSDVGAKARRIVHAKVESQKLL